MRLFTDASPKYMMLLWEPWSRARCPCPQEGLGTRWSLRSFHPRPFYGSMIGTGLLACPMPSGRYCGNHSVSRFHLRGFWGLHFTCRLSRFSGFGKWKQSWIQRLLSYVSHENLKHVTWNTEACFENGSSGAESFYLYHNLALWGYLPKQMKVFIWELPLRIRVSCLPEGVQGRRLWKVGGQLSLSAPCHPTKWEPWSRTGESKCALPHPSVSHREVRLHLETLP